MKYVTLGKICKYTAFVRYVFPHIRPWILFIYTKIWLNLYILCSVQLSLFLHEVLNLLHCVEQKSSKTLFLPNTRNKWNKIDLEIRRSDSYVGFRNELLSFIKTYWGILTFFLFRSLSLTHILITSTIYALEKS